MLIGDSNGHITCNSGTGVAVILYNHVIHYNVIVCVLQGAMSEETRQKLSLVDLTGPPERPYSIPIPKDGTVYDYKFIKEVSVNW